MRLSGLVAEPPIISYLALRLAARHVGMHFASLRRVEFLCGVLWAALILRFGVGDILLWFWIARAVSRL